jgi:AcrR family transcriptional regulator
MGRPKEYGEETRAALLEAAARVLASEGAAEVSVRRLSSDVGVSTRAVYSLFGSKEGVLGALYRESFQRLRARLQALPLRGDPVEDMVAAGLRCFRAYALEHENMFRLVFERLVPDLNPGPEEQAVAMAAFTLLKQRAQRVVDAGLAGRRDAGQVAMQFHATCQGLAAVELLGWFAPLGPERVWQDTLHALLRGLATEEAPRARKRDRKARSKGQTRSQNGRARGAAAKARGRKAHGVPTA